MDDLAFGASDQEGQDAEGEETSGEQDGLEAMQESIAKPAKAPAPSSEEQ
ncbi:hypothetical protein JG670_06100 [Campylobacter upsaliensis]|nr:hypothetical protein [Campylobacter upsaliensis]